MDFITIDFETATSERDSPCEIGLTFVSKGQITDTKAWLIKPRYRYFHPMNVSIHGIREADVRDQLEFGELWTQIRPLVEGKFLIAHNASFDFSVLRKTLEAYRISYPSLHYSCSYLFSKQVWTGLPNYRLNTLCAHANIGLNHHRAAADSRATAELCLKAFQLANVSCKEDFPDKLSTTLGRLFEGGYIPSRTRK